MYCPVLKAWTTCIPKCCIESGEECNVRIVPETEAKKSTRESSSRQVKREVWKWKSSELKK